MYCKFPRIRKRDVKLVSFTASYILFVITINSVFVHRNSDNYVENLQKIRDGKFTKPGKVEPPSAEYINLGMIIINLKKTENLDENFLDQIRKVFNDIFLFSSGTPLHFIIVTDKFSIAAVSLALSEIITEDIGRQAILDQSWRWRRKKGLPLLAFSFVDTEDILDIDRDFVAALKKQNLNGNDATKDKYAADLFYIAPLYHKAFQAIDRMIFMDSTDLVIVSDIKDLQDRFDNIEDDAVMEVGLDLSPHYRTHLSDYYLTDLLSELGMPGRYQGLNTGVVLFHLQKMRESKVYNDNLTPGKVDALFKYYKMKMTVGDQDWFTLLSFEHPDLFTILPCQFNTQTSIQYWSSNKEIFHSFHHCDVLKNIKIFHRNGCGPNPEHCGSPPAELSEYREYINFFIFVNPENLWTVLYCAFTLPCKLLTPRQNEIIDY
eukprot:TRINITY_DN26183_c0_g1_i1.p1 TRINITY_DN26183_c0_g1~~TRINITY_DN26183_c0_g1_i1.p1  ORF type:complete len:433 (-),score=76.24 TRINITY_DN26183_c0_g1_i1:15-1313(-)